METPLIQVTTVTLGKGTAVVNILHQVTSFLSHYFKSAFGKAE